MYPSNRVRSNANVDKFSARGAPGDRARVTATLAPPVTRRPDYMSRRQRPEDGLGQLVPNAFT